MPDSLSEKDMAIALQVVQKANGTSSMSSWEEAVLVPAIASALAVARREQAEADAKVCDERAQRCYEMAGRISQSESKARWVLQGNHYDNAAADIRARTTGGE